MIDPFQDDPRIALIGSLATVAVLRARIEREFAKHDAAADRIETDRADIFIDGADELIAIKREAYAREWGFQP